mmetsp:Transcript_29675/g.75206  ORF Transcript_29675/g.75206 Transcript_29675/m.75206 type:complete len:221 (+) Transcript_29675:103-765(+)|eukprot:CAMPEP_0183433528 /NCGR_PEP_ID=MMETSP0370-20130417/61448_1 /TAXON_ID=268820 /ORGANISM="Peridinium aciculiferum, Strain PAER-2" /LENGTH=220 /DNA_ID=CAMNT_0025619889 /DNA_START=81 /DNA_END=743 /DNA_ORIENTATION=+
MYLTTVLDAIGRKGGKFTAEDLYKLNEAIFNLPEVDVVNQKTTLRVFDALQTVMKAYSSGSNTKRDQSFFYDYVALLATMQNQHFFNDRQNRTILTWLFEALQDEFGPAQPAKGGKGAAAPAKDVSPQLKAEVARLESENEALKKEVEKLRVLGEAVVFFQKYKAPAAPGAEPKEGGKSKDKKKKSRKSKKVGAEDGEDKKEEAGEENEEEKEEKEEEEE